MSSTSVLHPALSRSSTRDKTTAGLRHRPPAAPCSSPRNFPREPAARALPAACTPHGHRAPHAQYPGTADRTGTARGNGHRSAPGHRTLPAPPYPSRRPEDGLRLLKEIQRIDGAAGPARSEGRPFHLPPPPAPLRSGAAPSRAARAPRAGRAPFAWVRPQRRARAAGRSSRGVGGRQQVHAPGVPLTATRPPPIAGAELGERCGRCVPSARAPRCRREHRAVTSKGINGHEHRATARDIMPCP